MADYPYYDEDPKRRAKRRRRRNYADDAWGMAYYEDSYDGDAADIEDWAAGMVDEEGRREEHYRPDEFDDGPYTSSDYPRSRHYSQNYRVPEDPSPAVDRAKRLAGRMVFREDYAPGKRGTPTPATRQDMRRRKKPAPPSTGRGFDVSWPVVISLVIALVTACSCGVLLLYFLVG